MRIQQNQQRRNNKQSSRNDDDYNASMRYGSGGGVDRSK